MALVKGFHFELGTSNLFEPQFFQPGKWIDYGCQVLYVHKKLVKLALLNCSEM